MLKEIDFMTIEEMEKRSLWPISWIAGVGLPSLFESHFGTKKLVGAEIGVCRGETSYTLLEKTNIKKLYLIDAWAAYDDWIGHISQDTMDRFKDITVRNLSKFDSKKYEIITSDSLKAAPKIKDNTLDFVFIDADHSYDGVYKDITSFYSKVKVNGIVSGHDFNMGSVNQAVKDYIESNKLEVELSTLENDVWYWIKK